MPSSFVGTGCLKATSSIVIQIANLEGPKLNSEALKSGPMSATNTCSPHMVAYPYNFRLYLVGDLLITDVLFYHRLATDYNAQ